MTDSTTSPKTTGTSKKIVRGALITAFWLLLWHIVYLFVGKEILVVSPFRAASRLLELAAEAAFWKSVGNTCMRVLFGFACALVAGGVLAVLSARYSLVYDLFRPLLGVVKATPVASFIILALVWMSSGSLPAFSAFLMVIPVVWANLYAGVKAADPQLLEMAKVFRFSRRKTARLIYIPAILPYFAAACSSGLGFAWKSAVAAEVISHPKHSVGTGIYNAKVYLETADLFAWTIAVILISILLERLLAHLTGALSKNLLRGGGGGEAKT